MTDGYILNIISTSNNIPAESRSIITTEIIELKRSVIKFKREIKNKTKQNESSNPKL